MTPRRLAAVTLALVALGALAARWRGGDEAPTPVAVAATVELSSPVTVPQDWVFPAWQELFSREDWRDAGPLDAAALTDASLPDPQGAREVAQAALRARLAASDGPRAGFESYLQDPFASDVDAADPLRRYAGRCRDVDVAVAAPARLPSPGEVAKVLVVWGGDCVDGLSSVVLGGQPRDPSTLQVSYVYLRRSQDRWEPVRDTELPGSAAGVLDSGAQVPAALLAPLRCGPTPVSGTARVELAEAFSAMCTAAAADGVALEALGALRDAGAQRQADEPGDGGTPGGDDGACASRHCAGWAVDVGGAQAARWLSQVVGCQAPDGSLVASSGSCEGTAPVTRALSYGFAQPRAAEPGHLEYVLPPLVRRWTASCAPPASSWAPEVVASVWRCRLGEAGLSREEVRAAVAAALVVSRCESGWNDGLVRGSGAQRSSGLFQLTDDEVARLTGSPGDASAARGADAAARLYLSQRRSGGSGFARWQCASQLAPGAVAVPAWAYQW